MAKKKCSVKKPKKKNWKRKPKGLRVIRENVAGIDVGSEEHYVCGPPNSDGTPNIKVFRATTPELNRLADWLAEQGVESVAMESTGVYWIPLYEVLVGRGLEVVLGNTRELANVPGRKSDMQDCVWLQLLHSCGLVRASFRPPDEYCRVRVLTRDKLNLVEERSDWLRRMQKSLDQMNVRVHRAVSDLSGVTGLAIVRAIVDGERDPMELAKLRDPRCRNSEAVIAEQLTGNWREDHLFSLKHGLQMYDVINEQIAEYDEEILRVLKGLELEELAGTEVPSPNKASKARAIRQRGQEPMREALYRLSGVDLTSIDGVGVETAETVISEYGIDLSMFPREGNFVSHVLLVPRVPISGGKPVKKKKRGTASTRVGAAFRMAALTVQRSQSALGAYYRRIARHKGRDVAVFATARKIAVLVYRMLRWGQAYVDEGAAAYELRYQMARLQSLRTTAGQLGFQLVAIAPEPDAGVDQAAGGAA
jgi:transposase